MRRRGMQNDRGQFHRDELQREIIITQYPHVVREAAKLAHVQAQTLQISEETYSEGGFRRRVPAGCERMSVTAPNRNRMNHFAAEKEKLLKIARSLFLD